MSETGEQPYPDFTDSTALEKLHSISIDLLNYNKEDRAYEWGDTLYKIYGYLFDRFYEKNIPNNGNNLQDTKNTTENGQTQDDAGGKRPGRGASTIFTGNIQTVNVTVNYHV